MQCTKYEIKFNRLFLATTTGSFQIWAFCLFFFFLALNTSFKIRFKLYLIYQKRNNKPDSACKSKPSTFFFFSKISSAKSKQKINQWSKTEKLNEKS